jgi:5-methylcytosine-specific restriction protein A
MNEPTVKRKLTQLKPSTSLIVNASAPAKLQTDWQGQHRGSTKERGYGGDWKRRRLRILKRDNYVCQCTRCKADEVIRPAHEVDHRIPQFEGGGSGDDNLQAINRDCHAIKSEAEALRARGLAR